MRASRIIIIGFVLALCSCSTNIANESSNKSQNDTAHNISTHELKKVQILNFGTFHMGFTSDENTTEFDERNLKNQKQVHEIAQKLSSFKPTVILVETPPEIDGKIQSQYSEYVENPSMFFENPSELELLAYELGRLSGTKRIYGIDHKMGYNYKIGSEIENLIDADLHDNYYKDPINYHPEIGLDLDSEDLLAKLKQINQDAYLDFLITVNADILSHAGTEKGFEGADEAARYYQRNLRMYSNMNRLKLTANDRVFILMGASHTAFFRDFLSRSPKYEMVDTFEYLTNQ